MKKKKKKIETFDSIYFHGKSSFKDNGTQIRLVFQPIQRYFKIVRANNINILLWKSNWLSDESIKPPSTSNKMLNPLLDYVGTKVRVKVNGNCLKQDKITFNHGKIVEIDIFNEIEKGVNISSYPKL